MSQISDEVCIPIGSVVDQHMFFADAWLFLREHEIIDRLSRLRIDVLRSEERKPISLSSSREPILSDTERIYLQVVAFLKCLPALDHFNP